jgi:wobble nucleotide-excising tRNase
MNELVVIDDPVSSLTLGWTKLFQQVTSSVGQSEKASPRQAQTICIDRGFFVKFDLLP